MMEREWSDGGLRLFENLPGTYSLDDPVLHAILDPMGRELDRLEALAQDVREQMLMNITDEDSYGFLRYWEDVFGLPRDPATPLTVPERRERVIRAFRLRSVASGQEWVDRVTEIVGVAFTYHEEDDYLIRMVLPFDVTPGGERFEYVRAQVEKITPAHLTLVWEAAEGFIVGKSPVGGVI